MCDICIFYIVILIVKTILKHLRRTNDAFLFYGGLGDKLVVSGYAYASFEIDIEF